MKTLSAQLSVVNDSKSIALVVVACILVVALVCLAILLIVKFINRNKNKTLNSSTSSQNNEEIEKQLELLNKKNQILDRKLEEVSGYSKAQAKHELLNNLENELSKYINKRIHDANQEIKQNQEKIAQQLIVEAMESIAEESVINNTTYTINLKNDNVKGHIIGKNGKNITTFKEVTGVDVIIDKEQSITLSSLNPKKREIGRLTMNKLLSKNIDPLTIKKVYEEQKKIFQQTITDYGMNAVETDLKIYDLNKALYPLIGNLYFRTSFSQNALAHSIEVAKLCEKLAKELNADPIKAKKIGLLHDIGKSVDYETDYDHVGQGVLIVKKYWKDHDLINAIESHHNQVPPNNIYSWIVKIADTISAARPGARNTTTEEYLKRVKQMEDICYEFQGVNEAHVYHAGRTLLVFVDPSQIDENQYEKLAFDIRKKLEENDLTNFYQIDITINRTSTFTTKTTPKIR